MQTTTDHVTTETLFPAHTKQKREKVVWQRETTTMNELQCSVGSVLFLYKLCNYDETKALRGF